MLPRRLGLVRFVLQETPRARGGTQLLSTHLAAIQLGHHATEGRRVRPVQIELRGCLAVRRWLAVRRADRWLAGIPQQLQLRLSGVAASRTRFVEGTVCL